MARTMGHMTKSGPRDLTSKKILSFLSLFSSVFERTKHFEANFFKVNSNKNAHFQGKTTEKNYEYNNHNIDL